MKISIQMNSPKKLVNPEGQSTVEKELDGVRTEMKEGIHRISHTK